MKKLRPFFWRKFVTFSTTDLITTLDTNSRIFTRNFRTLLKIPILNNTGTFKRPFNTNYTRLKLIPSTLPGSLATAIHKLIQMNFTYDTFKLLT